MQHRKILVASLSVLLVALALPSIPRAHAFLAVPPSSVTFTGLGINGFTDPTGQSGTYVDGIAAGSTLTVNVYLVASSGSALTQYQRNVTVGYKGDWMSSYQNATTASSTSTFTMTQGQVATITLAITMPSTGGIAAHTWSVAVWDGAKDSANAASCSPGNNPDKVGSSVPPACDILLSPVSSFSSTGFHMLAIYTADQLAAAQANVQAKNTVLSVAQALDLLSTHPNTPGITAASGQLAQASTELTIGNQAWTDGDYSGAKTHYQNALNAANAAAGSLNSQGGGVDNATLVNLVLGGTGLALIGVGALLAGIGALLYLRRKPKA